MRRKFLELPEEESPRSKDGKMPFMRYLSWFCSRLCSCTNPQLDEEKIQVGDEREIWITPEKFHQILKERQAQRKQKAQDERLRRIERITDMKSRTGIDPRELFPTEIWVKILDKMKPGDRANIYQVHGVFRCLLEDTWSRDILLSLLMDYKRPLFQKYLTSRPGRPSRILPRRPNLSHLMTLRRVSKSLRDAVDEWIEDRLLNQMRISDSSTRRHDHVLNSFEINMTTEVTRFDRFIGGLNRFPLRSVRIDFNCPDFYRLIHTRGIEMRRLLRDLYQRVWIFSGTITEFLRKVGDRILHIDFDFTLVEFHIARYFYDMIQEWLPLLPHLKWLELRLTRLVAAIDNSVVDDEDVENIWPLIRDHEPMTRMPTVGGLERFDFYSTFRNEIENGICDAVLTANPHLKYFTRECLGQSYSHINTINNPLVLSLPLEVIKIGDGLDFVQSLPSLQQISNNLWNLKRIILWLGQNGVTYRIEDVFGFLQLFQTLEKVELHVDHIKIGEEISFLKLPDLKIFRLKIGPRVDICGSGASVFFSLQFLVYCEKLRSLTWEDATDPQVSCLVRDRSGGIGIMMDFKGGRGDLSASNIWDVFQYLRSVTVQFVEGGKNVRLEYQERRLVSELRTDK